MCSAASTIVRYLSVSGPDKFSPHLSVLFLSIKCLVTLSSDLHPRFRSGLFHSGSLIQSLYTFISSRLRATCLAHFIFLDLNMVIIFYDE